MSKLSINCVAQARQGGRYMETHVFNLDEYYFQFDGPWLEVFTLVDRKTWHEAKETARKIFIGGASEEHDIFGIFTWAVPSHLVLSVMVIK